MKRQIRITPGSIAVLAEFNDTETADGIWEVLPLSSDVNLWGDEMYIAIPVQIEMEKGQEVVEMGDLGYWLLGNAFCIFFGATPVSGQGDIRAASAVSILDKVTGNPEVFNEIQPGEKIIVTRT